MGLPGDGEYLDLTVDAPRPDDEHAARIARAYAALTDGEAGFRPLFDGRSTAGWAIAGAGAFVVAGDRLESVPGDDLGLFWHTEPTPADFVLRLDWLCWRQLDASGVFVRFPRPDGGDDGNPAFTAIQRGFEVQIDDLGLPGGGSIHRTGAIFNQPLQRLWAVAARPPAEWNSFEIAVRGQTYTVSLNGEPACEFVNRDPRRGLPTRAGAPSFVGLQLCPGSRVAFRNIRIRPLVAG